MNKTTIAAWAGTREDVELVTGNEGQIKAGEAIRAIIRELQSIPEESTVLGLVFGITLANAERTNSAGTGFDTNIVALKWGLPPAIAVAAEQALGVAP